MSFIKCIRIGSVLLDFPPLALKVVQSGVEHQIPNVGGWGGEVSSEVGWWRGK